MAPTTPPFRLTRFGLACSAAVMLCLGCEGGDERTPLRVFMADSLTRPFGAAARAFERENPGVEIIPVPSGSVMAVRKLTEANDQADVLAVADYRLIDRLMRPQHADWYICFATNEIGIAYTDASKGAAELTADNWFNILARDGVKVAAANPVHDPGGYWTELCWRLADLHYPPARGGGTITQTLTAKCGDFESRRSDAQQLLQLLESAGGIDYAFVYRSQALQHNLPFLRLPAEINLGDPTHEDFYHRAAIDLPGRQRGTTSTKRGAPIVFAITIPKTVKHADLAARYIAFLLSEPGRAILEAEYLTLVDRPWTYDGHRLPASLRDQVETRPRAGAADTSPSRAYGR